MRNVVARVAVSFQQLQPHNNQSEIAGSRKYKFLGRQQQQGLFCHLFQSDYCVAAARTGELYPYEGSTKPNKGKGSKMVALPLFLLMIKDPEFH